MTTSTASADRARPSADARALRRTVERDRTRVRWVRPSFVGLLALTAALYLWALADSGTANSFYAAAVQAGATSWKAFFFGSLDAANFITVDKPPASLWVMGLSARLFGFSSWSLLVPQALMGVASVALVFVTVRRSLATLGARASAVGGLLGGLVLAATPAAALMFRFDNPDALLTLLMTVAAYCVVRALPAASWKWLALAGAALGFAFLTKMLQGLLVLPAFGLVYLVAADATLGRRIRHLLAAAGTLVVAAGWWVLAVALWPADARPYIGGSTNNSVLDLVFGYNGLGRLFGGSGNGGGGGSGSSGSSFGGATGLQRLFSGEMGLEIAWLLPSALLALVLGLAATRRRGRLDPLRAGLVTWGGWLLVTGLVFSFMSGTIHPYYTVALAPALGGLVGTAGVLLWTRRRTWLGRAGLALMVAISGVTAFTLLSENASWLPWLRWTLLLGALLSAAGIVVGSWLRFRGAARLLAVTVLTSTLFGLGGSAAWAVSTASVAHTGSIPSSGSVSSGPSGFGGGMGGGMGGGGTGGGMGGGAGVGGTGGGAGAGGTPAAATRSGTAAAGGGGGGAATSSAALTTLLKAAGTRWSAATDGSQSAATLELASGTAVMAIGGWSSDPTPTLAQFQAAVKAGQVRYYVGSAGGVQGGGTGGAGAGAGAGGRGGSTSTAISTWVKAHYTATTVGGSTVYDLTRATS